MARLPANQLFMPFQRWPWPIPDHIGTLPNAGVSEDTARRWFYLVRYWELAVSGSYHIEQSGSFSADGVFSGTQIIPGRKLALLGEEESWESDELTEPRDLWKPTSAVVESGYGINVWPGAYTMLGHPWGVECEVNTYDGLGDPSGYGVEKVGRLSFFSSGPSRDPANHDTFFPDGFLRLDPGFMEAVTTLNAENLPDNPVVGTFSIEGTYSRNIIVPAPSISRTYTGDIVATLTPTEFWTWGEIGTGNNPRYNATTGEKTANW